MNISEEKLKRLSPRERDYFDLMNSGASLYLRGDPGSAKSAIGKSIQKKLEINYIDKRLSQIDETDIGLYPVLKDLFAQLERIGRLKKLGVLDDDEFIMMKKSLLQEIKNKQFDTLSYAVPDWALQANMSPTIIHIEELNRASTHVRNAALQLLNERQIGNLVFNDNVLIMASGNYGDQDGTEVDEMDLALSNRLCILDHKLSYEEWINEFAAEHVLPLIVDYIRAKPLELSKFPNDKEIRWASPRSWTNLSNFILYRYGQNPDIKKLIPDLLFLGKGKGFIGNSITGFIQYCQDVSNISINDIVNRWDEVKDEASNFNRARLSELIANLKYIDLTTIDEYKVENIIKFLESIWVKNGDEITPYLLHIVESTNDKNYNMHEKIIRHFSAKSKLLYEYVRKNIRKS